MPESNESSPGGEPVYGDSSNRPSTPERRSQLKIWHSAAAKDARGPHEARCESLLLEEEISGANRFRLATSRNQHIIGRAMARRLLGDLDVPPSRIRFAFGDHGKPEVSDPPEAQQPFNIAHTDGLVLCAVADQTVETVGVDVEAVDRRTSTELAERYFAKPEVDYLRSQPVAEQKRHFLRIWTLKEAFIKAIGTGLHTPLSDFAFEKIDSERPQIRFLSRELDDQRPWKFVCFEPREGFIASAALVAKQEGAALTVEWRPFESLIDTSKTGASRGGEIHGETIDL